MMHNGNEIVALVTLAVFQQFIIASLVALVMLLTVSPDSAKRLRAWLAIVRNWMA